MLSYLSCVTVGLSTMVDERFGINVVAWSKWTTLRWRDDFVK